MLPVLAAKQSSTEAGISGEERVAEVLRKSTFPFELHTFHDLSPRAEEKFQTDTFCFTPWYGVVFEVKNIAGLLEFKENPPQLIRTLEDGHKDGYESPVVQLERNREFLSSWFKSRKIYLPIYGAVVLAYPKQIVKLPPAKTKILFPNLIPSFIKDLPQQAKKLDIETFQRISKELLNSHERYIPKPICESYRLSSSDFKPGVRCLTCGKIGMIKLPRTWHCPFCKGHEHLAHQRTLLEWFLIFKRSITNRECREFLGVDVHTATRILQSMNLQSTGKFRNQAYSMTHENIPAVSITGVSSHSQS
ncbi:NERD domain-containing protein [Bacillus sp. BRMEA1]|nr:NERD domain-containing protein [Neobacillus endophyticus]